jgi:hypothetical protein
MTSLHDELLNALNNLSRNSCSVLDVLRTLLKFLRERKQQLKEFDTSKWKKRIPNAVLSFSKNINYSGAYNPGEVVKSLLDSYSTTVENWPTNLSQDVRSLAFALIASKALDEAFKDMWLNLLRDENGTRKIKLRKGNLIPIFYPFSENEIHAQLGPDRRLVPDLAKVDGKITSLKHIGILPDDLDFEVHLHTKCLCHSLGSRGFAFHDQKKISPVGRHNRKRNKSTEARGWPTLATGLLNSKSELHGHTIELEGSKYIRNFHPMNVNKEFSDVEEGSDKSSQLSRFKTLMTLANEKQVDVIVLPECCFSADTQDQITKLFSGGIFNSHYSSVVVIGSSHVCTPEQPPDAPTRQRNRLRLFVKSCQGKWMAFDHFKYNPAQGIKLNDIGEEVADEQLDDTEKIVNIICGSNKWSVVPLVCKDFLDPSLMGLWSIVRPTLVLVCSYSEISGPFVTAGVAAASARSLVVVADNGICDDDLVTHGNQSSGIDSRKKRFSIFVLPAVDGSGNTGCLYESPFSVIPKFPQLIWVGFANGSYNHFRPISMGYSTRLRAEN